METQDAPAAVLSRAFSSGQSATASRAVFHAFGFAEGRRDGAAVEVIAADHDRRFDLAFLHQIVHRQAELGALAVAEPADARGQSLELDALAREIDPAAENAVLGEQLEDQFVGDVNVGGLTGERDPAERAAAFAEQRTNVGGHESGEIVGVLHAALEGEGADVVAVVEGD